MANLFKLLYIVSAILFTVSHLAGQSLFGPPQYRDETRFKKDLNNDGYDDAVHCYYDGGSGFGGTNLTIKNGKTKQVFEFSTFGSKWPTIIAVPIHPHLDPEKDKIFCEQVEKLIFPSIKVKQPEPCLQWVLDGFKSKKVSGPDSSYFEFAFGFQPRWQKGEVYLPKNYFVLLKSSYFFSAMKNTTIGDLPAWFNENTKGWAICYSQNIHGNNLEKTYLDSEFEVFKAHKSVILKQENSYMWVFIDEGALTGGSDKWGRVKDAIMLENFIFIETTGEMQEQNLFVIDHLNGICAKFKYDILQRNSEDWIVNQKLTWDPDHEVTILQKIQREMGFFYTSLKK